MIDLVQDTVEAFELPTGMCLTVRPSTGGAIGTISLLSGAVTLPAVSTPAGSGSATVGPFTVPCRVAVGARGVVSVEITNAASQALVSVDGNVTAAALPTLVGTPGQLVRLSDGDDAGALLVWAIPEGSASYAWCWQIWPRASYF